MSLFGHDDVSRHDDAWCFLIDGIILLFCIFIQTLPSWVFEEHQPHELHNLNYCSIHSCSTWLESGVFVLERPHSYPPNARNNQNMGGLRSFKERVSFSEVGSTTVQMLYHRRYLGKAANQAGPANVVRPLVEDKLLTREAAGNRS